MDDWVKTRRQELEAAAPIKRDKAKPFAQIPLAWAAQAADATNCPKAMVWVWLVYRAWQDKSTTIAVPNGALGSYGVSREVKRRALAELETAGLITVARRQGKTPIVTLCYL